MKNYVVMRRAVGEEVQKVSDALNKNMSINILSMCNRQSEVFDIAIENIDEWMRFVVPCENIDTTPWGATIKDNIITLPTNETIHLDDMGRPVKVCSEEGTVNAEDFWENATTVTSNKNFKLIYDNSMSLDNHPYHITLIGYSPTYKILTSDKKCGCIAYEEYFMIVGTDTDMDQLLGDKEECKLAALQLWYEYAVCELLGKNKHEIDLLIRVPATFDELMRSEDEDDEIDTDDEEIE